jgi:hypothetical protein
MADVFPFQREYLAMAPAFDLDPRVKSPAFPWELVGFWACGFHRSEPVQDIYRGNHPHVPQG